MWFHLTLKRHLEIQGLGPRTPVTEGGGGGWWATQGRRYPPGAKQRRTFGGRKRGGIQLLSSVSIFAEKFLCEALLSVRMMKENVGSLPFRSPQASEILRYLLDWICCPDQICTLRNLHIFRKVLLYILQTCLSTCCYCSHHQLSTQGGNSGPEKQGLQNQGCGSERGLKASGGSSRNGSRGRDQKLHIIGKGPSWRRTGPRRLPCSDQP